MKNHTRIALGVVSLVLVTGALSPPLAFAQDPTPTPNPRRFDEKVRALDAKRFPESPFNLGTLLRAHWHSRLSGGDLSVDSTVKVAVAPGNYVINGVPLAAASPTPLVLPSGVTTTSAPRKATICLNISSVYRIQPGATAATQALALKPLCADTEVEVGYIEVPVSFTANSTTVTAGMLKQAATLASQVKF